MSGVPDIPDISIRQLQYLVAVADHPTWARAADAVGVSQSALSQGLAELERRIGVALFEPVGRRRLVRAEAAPVLAHARQVVAMTGDVVAWAARIRGADAGRVRLGMIDSAAVTHFPESVRSFRHEHPDVDVRLVVEPSAVLLRALRDGHVDLVVCVTPPQPLDGIDCVDLFREPLHVLAPADVPAADLADPTRWGPWLLFPTGSHTRTLIGAALARRGVQVTVAAESHQPEVLLQMTRIGVGWTVLPVGPATTAVAIGPELVSRQLVLARCAASVTDPAVTALAATITLTQTPCGQVARR